MSPTKIIRQKEKGMNRHWKNFVDKDYLGSHNLEAGEEMLLTIAKFAGEEEVLSKPKKGEDAVKMPKPVLYFSEKVPKLILNMTNGNTLSQLYGNKPEGWIGKKVQLYAASVRAFGKVQDAIRIRDFVPQITVDVAEHTDKLKTAKSLEELKKLWTAMPTSVRNDKDMVAAKDAIKAMLSEVNNATV